MYLKEAFRYQNYLNGLISTTISYLGGSQYTTKTVQEHLRKKANPDVENETIDLSAERDLDCSANQMVDFCSICSMRSRNLLKRSAMPKEIAILTFDFLHMRRCKDEIQN